MAPASEIVTSPPVASTTAAACAESATSILLDAPDFRSAVLRDWRGLVRGGTYNEALRTYCAVCGQYVHMIGPGLKQHLRLAHPNEYARHQEEAESRPPSMDVPMEEQAALAQAEYAEVFGSGSKEKEKDKDKEKNDPWLDQERKPKYSRGEGKAGKGGSWNAASSWDPKGSWGQQAGRQKWGDQGQNEGTLDAQTQHLIQAMVRLSLRHEQELGMIRAETGFMLFLDTPMHHPMSFLPKLQEIAADWTEKNAAGLVKTGLKVMLMMALVKELQTRLEAFREEPEKITRAEATGWIGQGATEMDPVWHYFVWNPKTKQQERSDQQPVATSVLLASLDILFKNLAAPGVLQRFRSTKGLEGNFDSVEVVPFLLWIGLRSNQAHLCYQAFMQLAGSAVTKLLGLRIRPERLARQPAAKKVEECFKAVSYCDWSNRS
ncbi:hypothetical protein AK812_SmicGene38186 [Symbiodinium microadriaticum]|uniref:Uncharacterized protein n=1 Tax=Symbiodinium microadriaticum TaxID=2951 RepID=A0A1Q9CEE8_SYMMI|nr:hypothetical protein AK812_SmicGene38186 [Symbiodinium microadriaticum]